MIEVNGPGGMYAELARTFCLGEPSPELLKIWEDNVEAQKLTASLLKPGAVPGDILKANNDYMAAKGYIPEGRLFAHGQGYDLVERPAIRTDETMVLKANMNIAVHPRILTDKAYTFCCDNYLITENGGERLHQVPLKIFTVPV
jgi:Xaa-Pro aminopeptidase